MVELDTEDADQVGFALVVNVTLENAGRYICFAEFANITAKRDIYIAILRKSINQVLMGQSTNPCYLCCLGSWELYFEFLLLLASALS